MLRPNHTSFASRVGAVCESQTTRVFTLAQELRSQGKDIVSLAVGEPDFDTPAKVVEATSQALADQATRYGPVAGIDELRRELARGFDGCGQDHVVITNGAKQALFTLFQVLCNPEDEVIVPAPCWVSFTEQIKIAGGNPVLVDTIDHQLDLRTIEDAITDRTKAILVNSPNNPTGAIYSKEALEKIANIADEHGLYVISDEAYHAFTFDGIPHTDMWGTAVRRDRIIIVRSFSKHYCMTGFRLGYAVAHPSVIHNMAKLQGHISGNVCTFAQYGALAALQTDPSEVENRRRILEQHRDMAYDAAKSLFDCVKPRGAFYLFPNVTRYLKKDETSEDLAMRLLNSAGVAVVPGEAFGSPGHIRISFGVKEKDLLEAFERIGKAL